MARVSLSAAARVDLADIRRYSLREYGSTVADAYLRGFQAVFGILKDHPGAGAPQPSHGPTVRCFTYRRHRIFYRLDGDMVRVIRILHHARNVTPDLFR